MKRREVIGIAVRLSQVLGKGAFGEVFLAHPIYSFRGDRDDVDYPSSFALKIIHSRLCDKLALSEIEREMTTVESFHHPHIVSAVDKWIEVGPSQYKGCFCLAMGLCDGGDLGMYIHKQRIKGSLLSIDCVVRVMVHVLSALNFSHSKGIIHRDIKPTNVFIVNEKPPKRGQSGEVIPKAVVGDFGLSRSMEHSTEMAKTRVGTPGYLSPEIIQSKPYNFKTDIFSAGVLFYELMTLERPFWKPHYSNSNIFWCTISTDPASTLMKTCKDWAGHCLCEVVGKMLSKDPAQRPTAYEALTQYSSRLKWVVADEHILLIPDHQIFASPCSQLAIQEHKSLIGAELLVKPSLSDSLHDEDQKENKAKVHESSPPEVGMKENPNPNGTARNAAPPARASPRHPIPIQKDAPAATKSNPQMVHADPFERCKGKVGAGKSLLKPLVAGNIARQRLALKEKKEGKVKAIQDEGKEEEETLTVDKLHQKEEGEATKSPRKISDRLRKLKHCLTGQSPFASHLDTALWTEVGQDNAAFLLAKIVALSKEDGEQKVLASLRSCVGGIKGHRRILHEMLKNDLSLG